MIKVEGYLAFIVGLAVFVRAEKGEISGSLYSGLPYYLLFNRDYAASLALPVKNRARNLFS